MQHRNKGGNAKKIGRSRVKCATYRTRKVREKNKLRKLIRHLKIHFNDIQATKKVGELQKFIYGK